MARFWSINPEVKAAIKAEVKQMLKEDPVISTVRSAWRSIKHKPAKKFAGYQGRQTKGQNDDRQTDAERILSLETQVAELREELAKQQQQAAEDRAADHQIGAATSWALVPKKPSPCRASSQESRGLRDVDVAKPRKALCAPPSCGAGLRAASSGSQPIAVEKRGMIFDWRKRVESLEKRYQAHKEEAIERVRGLSRENEALRAAAVEITEQLVDADGRLADCEAECAELAQVNAVLLETLEMAKAHMAREEEEEIGEMEDPMNEVD